MGPDTTKTDADQIQWLDITEARRQTLLAVDNFARQAVEGGDTKGPPVLTLKISPGVGKTQAMLNVLAKRGADLLAEGNVLVFTPTLDLADQACRDLKALAPQLPADVYRGRLAARPGASAGETMCARPELIRLLQGRVPSITEAACRKERGDKKPVIAACHDGCPYMAQLRQDEHQVVFLAHALLRDHLPIRGPVSLVVIDEQIWSSRAERDALPFDVLDAAPVADFEPEDRLTFDRMTSALRRVFREGGALAAAMAEAGVTPEQMMAFGKAELAALPRLVLNPAVPQAEALERAQGFDKGPRRHLKIRAEILQTLADNGFASLERVRLAQETVDGLPRDVLLHHRFSELPRHAPTLLLDADADPLITERLFPGAESRRIDVKPDAEIIQILDRTMSPTSLLQGYGEDAGANARQLRDEVAKVIRREADRSDGKTLLVAPNSVLQALREDDGVAEDAELLGTTARHYGPKLQGVNTYRHYSTAILLGRIQPSVDDVEDLARSLFGDRGDSLKLIEGSRAFAERGAEYLMADGTRINGRCWQHPDPRANALLRQIREASLLQALARLRLTDPSGPKHVIVATNVPLPGFPVTRLTTWQAFRDDVPEGVEHPVAYKRLRDALQAAEECRGFRLSNQGLVADLCHAFPKEFHARQFRRNLTTDSLKALLEYIGHQLGRAVRFVELKRPGAGGKSTTAVLFDDADARVLWPELVVDDREADAPLTPLLAAA